MDPTVTQYRLTLYLSWKPKVISPCRKDKDLCFSPQQLCKVRRSCDTATVGQWRSGGEGKQDNEKKCFKYIL